MVTASDCSLIGHTPLGVVSFGATKLMVHVSVCCTFQVRGVFSTTSFPEIKCPYVAPEQCPVVEDAGVVLRASVAVLMVLSLLGAIVA